MEDMASIEAQIREEDVVALEKYEAGTGEAPILYRAGFLKAEDGAQVFVANEETEDRMGDVIAVDGWQLANFRRNPVLMFAHNYSIPPVGTVPRIWTADKQLLNTVRFDEQDEFATFLKGKYERRIMRAESVGFRPIEFERLDQDAKGFFAKFRFTKQELLEISLVPVPAHPKALRKALEPYDGTFHILMPEIPEIVTANGVAGRTVITIEDPEEPYLPQASADKLMAAALLIDEVLNHAEQVNVNEPDPDPEPAPDLVQEPEDDHAERLLAALQAGKN